jgi:ABC-2 type transport system permease protein
MTGALRYEVLRIRSIRSSFWLTGLALVLSAILSLVLVLVVNSTVPSDMTRPEVTTWVITSGASAVGMPILAAVLFAVMGALTMGHEYRYGTNKATLTALPDRIAVIAAKGVVLATWVVTSCLLILAVNLAIAGLWLDDFDLGSAAFRPMVNFVGYCVGFAWAGLSLATIFRNQTGAIVTVLVWPLVIEVIVLTVLRALRLGQDVEFGEVYNLLPASAGRRSMFAPYELFASFDNNGTGVWGLGTSVAIYWLAIIGLLAIATGLFVSRDA